MFCCDECLCAIFLMCVNVSFVIYCVILSACLVMLVCSFNVSVWFVFDLLCDVLWIAFVLCF